MLQTLAGVACSGRIRPVRRAALPIFLFFSAFTSAFAAPILDRTKLETFVDGIVTTAMEDHRIPGVVISLVQGGEIIFEKGYGFAREPERVPANPKASLFRIASISKTFNATALMQLVEQGKVDLDADFTTYLPGIGFNLPLGRVRVRDLITHSAGFEDGYFGFFWAMDATSDLTLEETVRRYQPTQVRRPGERLVYSNYGTSVIGLIIQRVSGLPYPEYMRKHVLDPLGMTRSGFRDSQTPTGEADLAHSYSWTGGRFKRPTWAWMHAGWQPAGGMLATAHEMTNFMRMHLGQGPSVLKPETLARMHQPLIGNHPFVNPNAHGFWMTNQWGYAGFSHGGSIFGFMSRMDFVPELGLGIFISTNSSSGLRLSGVLPRRIIGQFFPKKVELPAANPKADLKAYAGEYRAERRSYTTVEKAGSLFGPLSVSSNDQGYLAVTSGNSTSRYVPQGEDRFINPDTSERIAFTRDAQGRPFRMHNDTGHNNFERIGYWDSVRFAGLVAALLAFSLLARLMALWLYRKETLVETLPARIARTLTVAVIPCWITFGYAAYKDFNAADAPIAPHFAHFPTTLGWVWVVSGIAAAVLTGVLAVLTVPVWLKRSWTLPRRLAYTTYVLIGIVFVGLMHYWNILGLRILG